VRWIARYQLLETLGRGATATVFRARGPDGEVALKLARRDILRAAASLAVERDVLQTLDHPCVVPLLDHGIEGDVPWLALPVAKGARPEVAGMLRSIGSALAAAHAAGWIHGDVTTSHIMTGQDGSLMLVDWGSARRVGAPLGAAAGTSRFLPPEGRGAIAAAPSRDVYAFAAAVCGALEPGFQNPRRVAERAGPPWSNLLLAMLSDDPSVRPSAAEVGAIGHRS
jgi:serine/threonine protein kinase